MMPGFKSISGVNFIPVLTTLRLRLHEIGSIWNRYEIGTDKLWVYAGPGRSALGLFSYPVPNGLTYESDSV